MKLEQVSDHCHAVVHDKNRLGDANSGLINAGGGVVIDTQFDLGHARRMIDLFSGVWEAMPERVVNTHEDADHVWGNQLFPDAHIFAHRSVPRRMVETANPSKIQHLLKSVQSLIPRTVLRFKHPGLLAVGRQMAEDYDFHGIQTTYPTHLFDETLELDLGRLSAQLHYVGPGHQIGDTLVHVPAEGVVFAGDVLFRSCTPMGWTGTFENWIGALHQIIAWQPAVVVPGHGPVTDLSGVEQMIQYLQHVLEEARTHFDRGHSSKQAALEIDPGPYADWSAPNRIWVNVERAYRQFRGDPMETAWDHPSVFDTMADISGKSGWPIEF